MPVGYGWNGFISFFDLEDKKDAAKPAAAAPRGDLNDEIPF